MLSPGVGKQVLDHPPHSDTSQFTMGGLDEEGEGERLLPMEGDLEERGGGGGMKLGFEVKPGRVNREGKTNRERTGNA